MNDWSIRRARPGDADGLGDCLEAAYAEDAARIDGLPSMSEDCAGEIARHLVWVAVAGDTIVGGLVLVPGDGFMMLANVAVHPGQRGSGIGRRLLTLAESEALARGFAEMRLNTHADMRRTVRLYERNGWKRLGRAGKTIAMSKRLLPR